MRTRPGGGRTRRRDKTIAETAATWHERTSTPAHFVRSLGQLALTTESGGWVCATLGRPDECRTVEGGGGRLLSKPGSGAQKR